MLLFFCGLESKTFPILFAKDNKEEPLTDEKRSKIRENVEHAMRGGNLYNDATTEEDTEPETEDIPPPPPESEEKETETGDKGIAHSVNLKKVPFILLVLV